MSFEIIRIISVFECNYTNSRCPIVRHTGRMTESKEKYHMYIVYTFFIQYENPFIRALHILLLTLYN